MKPPKSMAGIFRDLHAKQPVFRPWGVFKIGKNGEPYKQPTSTQDTEDAARKEATRMMLLNPGSCYVVKQGDFRTLEPRRR